MNESAAYPNALLCRRISAHHPRCKLASVRATAKKPVTIQDQLAPGTPCTDLLFSTGNRWCLSRAGTDESSSRWTLGRSQFLPLPVWLAFLRMRRRQFSFWPASYQSIRDLYKEKNRGSHFFMHYCNSFSIFGALLIYSDKLRKIESSEHSEHVTEMLFY